jgi:prolyl-tRNA synthetase
MQNQESGKQQSHFNVDPLEDYIGWYRRVLFDANVIDNRYPLKGMYAWRGNGLFMRNKMFQICEETWREMGLEEVEVPTLMPIDLLNKMEEHALG